MANDTSLAPSAIQFCWRISPDVDVLLRDVVPHNATAYIAFLTLLETKGEVSGTAKVWNALIETRQPFEMRHVHDYVQFLIYHKDVDQAVLVWQQAADRFRLTSYPPSSNNLVVNSTFSLNILNAGFDWQYQKQSGVSLTLDPGDFHAGRRSLLINFDGPGIKDAGIYQFIAVQPNTTYTFSGYYKSNELQGAGGPHFTIQDMYSQAVYFESEELKESGFWKSVDGEFTTSADCKLIVLHVRRLPEGSPIRGKIWIDDFRLAKKTVVTPRGLRLSRKSILQFHGIKQNDGSGTQAVVASNRQCSALWNFWPAYVRPGRLRRRRILVNVRTRGGLSFPDASLAGQTMAR